MSVPNHTTKIKTFSHFHTLNTLQEVYPHINTYNHWQYPKQQKSLTSLMTILPKLYTILSPHGAHQYIPQTHWCSNTHKQWTHISITQYLFLPNLLDFPLVDIPIHPTPCDTMHRYTYKINKHAPKNVIVASATVRDYPPLLIHTQYEILHPYSAVHDFTSYSGHTHVIFRTTIDAISDLSIHSPPLTWQITKVSCLHPLQHIDTHLKTSTLRP